MKVLVAQSCPTFCNPMDGGLTGSSVHGILQARILEWVSISFSRGSSRPRDQTQVSWIAGGIFIIWATRDTQTKHKYVLKRMHLNVVQYSAVMNFQFFVSVICFYHCFGPKTNVNYFSYLFVLFLEICFLRLHLFIRWCIHHSFNTRFGRVSMWRAS